MQTDYLASDENIRLHYFLGWALRFRQVIQLITIYFPPSIVKLWGRLFCGFAIVLVLLLLCNDSSFAVNKYVSSENYPASILQDDSPLSLKKRKDLSLNLQFVPNQERPLQEDRERQFQEIEADFLTGAPFIPGEVFVRFADEQVRAAGVLPVLRTQLPVEIVAPLELCQRGEEERIRVWRLRTQPGEELSVIRELLTDPSVLSATPSWMVQAAGNHAILAATGSDNRNAAMRGDSSDSSNASIEEAYKVTDPLYAEHQWYLHRINESRAWAVALGNRSNSANQTTLRVAVIDSRANYKHPEFDDRLTDSINYVSGDRADDDFGHGSHVAGLIGAINNNGVGISGLARWVKIDP